MLRERQARLNNVQRQKQESAWVRSIHLVLRTMHADSTAPKCTFLVRWAPASLRWSTVIGADTPEACSIWYSSSRYYYGRLILFFSLLRGPTLSLNRFQSLRRPSRLTILPPDLRSYTPSCIYPSFIPLFVRCSLRLRSSHLSSSLFPPIQYPDSFSSALTALWVALRNPSARLLLI